MAAIFYNISESPKNIFLGGLQINTSVRIPFLDTLVGSGFTIIENVTVSNTDTTQFFITFDDFVSYFYFGKGIGAITISGTMFMDCLGGTPGVNIFYNEISRFRGNPVVISFGNAVFTAVITAFTTSAIAEPTPMVQFNINLNIINHSLAAPRFNALC